MLEVVEHQPPPRRRVRVIGEDGAEVRDRILSSVSGGVLVEAGDWAGALANVAAGSIAYEGASGTVRFDDTGSQAIRADGFVVGFDAQGTPVETGECISPEGVYHTCE